MLIILDSLFISKKGLFNIIMCLCHFDCTFQILGQKFIKCLRWFFGKLKTSKVILRLTDLQWQQFSHSAAQSRNQNSCFLINIPLVILLHYIHINIIKTKSSVIQSQYYKLRNIRLEELSSKNSCLAFVMFHFQVSP